MICGGMRRSGRGMGRGVRRGTCVQRLHYMLVFMLMHVVALSRPFLFHLGWGESG